MTKQKNIKIKLVIILFTLLINKREVKTAYAVTVSNQATVGKITPSPTLTPKPTATPTNAKIQEIRDVVKEKVQEKIQEIKDKLEKKGYVGILTEMTDSTLTINTLYGERMISLDPQAKIINASRKEIKVKDLEIDQRIICMGTLDDNKILVAKRIVVMPKVTTPPPIKEVFRGKITEINSKLKTISLTGLKKPNQKYLIKITKESIFSSGKFESLKVNDLLLIVTSKAKETDTPTALLISILPNP